MVTLIMLYILIGTIINVVLMNVFIAGCKKSNITSTKKQIFHFIILILMWPKLLYMPIKKSNKK